jgi:6-phosphogluconolactonase
MGPDGHIASLFPNTDPQIDDPLTVRRLTPDPLPAHAPFDRITLTIPALLNTSALVFTLGGAADKRAVFDAALRGETDLPVARLLRTAEAQGIPVTVFT